MELIIWLNRKMRPLRRFIALKILPPGYAIIPVPEMKSWSHMINKPLEFYEQPIEEKSYDHP